MPEKESKQPLLGWNTSLCSVLINKHVSKHSESLGITDETLDLFVIYINQMETLYNEIGIKESKMELKLYIDMGINGGSSSYNSTQDNNQTKTKFVLNPGSKHSLNDFPTNFDISESIAVCRIFDVSDKRKDIEYGM